MNYWIALAAALLLASAPVAYGTSPARAEVVETVEAAEVARGCRVENYWGTCFDTLPKLHCCSAAFLGWSEIVVGDRFPVSGNMAQGEPHQPATGLLITYPSGRTVTIPVAANGRFHQTVAFDEEGGYTVARVEKEATREFGGFQVGYRAELLDGPTVTSQFGAYHDYPGVTTAVVEADQTSELRIRFTDAQGEPVRSRTLTVSEGLTTDAEGVARLVYDAKPEWSSYTLRRLYPGLAVISARTVTVDENGVAHGLPGGTVAGYIEEGRTYLPLREFLEKADPNMLGAETEEIRWDEESRAVKVWGVTIMTDTGMVLGRGDYRADLTLRDGRTYLELDSLMRLVDQLGMASRTGESTFRISLAQVP